MNPDLLDRIKNAWCDIAGVSSFTATPTVRPAPHARNCPPGWCGVVLLAGETLMTAPDTATAERAQRLAATLSPQEACDPQRWDSSTVLGPARLSYLDAADLRTSGGPADHSAAGAHVTSVPADSDEVAALESAVDATEAGEAAVGDSLSAVFVTRDEEGRVTSACGYRPWVGTLAHMAVLTHPDHRRRGLARLVGAAAAQDAIDGGLIPQWRARVPASQAVARALGYIDLGAQLSFRL